MILVGSGMTAVMSKRQIHTISGGDDVRAQSDFVVDLSNVAVWGFQQDLSFFIWRSLAQFLPEGVES